MEISQFYRPLGSLEKQSCLLQIAYSQMNRVLFLCLVLLFALTMMCQGLEKIRLTNGEWAPYLSQNLPQHGCASDIVKKAFAAVGIEVDYGFFPWKRSYKLAKEGIWNGTVVWVYTEERAKDFLYSDVVISANEYLFHLKELDLHWETIDDLAGLKIGGTLHTVYPAFKTAEDRGIITIERSGTYANLFRRLLKKRIDAIPQVKQVGFYLIRKTLPSADQGKITYSPTIIQKRQYHLILSKSIAENAAFLRKFNEGLQIIKESGKYAQLLSALVEGEYDN